MNKALGQEELSEASQDNLEALVQAYGNINSCDTRRQNLSIMTGVASYKAISSFVPRLSRFMYMQFGHATPLTYQLLVRVPADQQQLDHFFVFHHEPTFSQDMPFGQNVSKEDVSSFL